MFGDDQNQSATSSLDLKARPAIDRLLSPRSIAIAGISIKPGSLGVAVLENLERFAFVGDIHLIHPTQAVLLGRPCVASASELPFGVDCVVLAIPAASIEAAVRACAERGVGAVVIFSAGFAELGPEGRALQDRIATCAAEAGMILEGPNCLGFANYADGVAITFAATEPRSLGASAVSVVSQSGAMSSVVRAALHGRALDVAFSISTGNEAANGLEDFVEYLINGRRSRVIALVAEHIREPRRFLTLARHARSQGLDLVLLHPGRSKAAKVATTTHTGAITGDHDIMRVLSARAGVLMVDTLEQLVDVCELLLRCPVRPTGGVAVLAESGAFKALTLDYADELELELPPPETAAVAALNAIAPGFIVASNPLDLTAQALSDPGLYGRAIEQLMRNPRCGTLLVVIILSSARMAERKMAPVVAAMEAWTATRAVVFAMLGDDTPISDATLLIVRNAGIPFFRSPERAMRALACLDQAGRGIGAADVRVPSEPASRLASGIIPEFSSKLLLAAEGLPIPPGRLAKDCSQAKTIADTIGYPVVLKAQSAALSHKSDSGGVVLNVRDEAALTLAWDRLHADVASRAGLASLDGVLVESMSDPGLELIVGARNDPQWGPVLAIGLGGVMAEALQDTRVIASDLTPEEILLELRKLKGAALLGPFRGRSARDVRAAADAVAVIGRFIRHHGEVTELDVNPLMVYGEGEGVMALDALIVCR